MLNLTKKEEILLLSIYNLKEAYGVNVRQHIHETTGVKWNYGTIYRMLDQLMKKGLLEQHKGEPLAKRGGRRKNYYSLSRSGVKTLQSAHELQKSLWGGISEIVIDNGRIA